MITNVFIIQRRIHELLISFRLKLMKPNEFDYLPAKVLYSLDYYIVEEEDGSATFLKNRYNNKEFMNPEEYREFKNSFISNKGESSVDNDVIDVMKFFK